MSVRSRAVLPSLCAAVAPLLGLQEPSDLTELLAPIRAEHGVPALAGAILERGEVTAIGACGLRRIGSDDTVTVHDRWHLGSCGKAMTATLIARLVEREELGWDTTLAAVFPERASVMDPGYRVVTVRQLVDHRAGLPEDRTSGSRLAQVVRSSAPVRAQRLALLDEVLAREPARPPGRETVYSNTGFILAGAVVERLTDRTWEEAVHAELFVPLGMTSAGFGHPGEPGSTTQPWGHVAGRERAEPIDPGHTLAGPPARYGPAGNVHASLSDWARFVGLHVRGDRAASELLSSASLATMHTPADGAQYACGFVVATRPWASGPALVHQGSSPRWHAAVWASPADDFAVLVTCNQGGEAAARACAAAAEALIRFRSEHGQTAETR